MRLTLVDALRGFALLGVIASNAVVLTGAGATGGPGSTLDRQIGEWSAYLVTNKFLSLFALLFGASFGLYLVRSGEAGRAAGPPFLRRLLILLLIGAAHRTLAGVDILMTYAILGAVLLLFRSASDRVLIVAAVASLGLPELWRAASQAAGYQPPPPLVPRAERLRLAIEGPYLDLVAVRARMLTRWWHGFLSQDTAYLALFLTGYCMSRRRLFQDPGAHHHTWRVLFWGALAITIAGHVAQSAIRPMLSGGSPQLRAIFGIVWTTTASVQGIAYAAGFVLLWVSSARARRALEWLAPAGRMALTNYLAPSILITAIVTQANLYGRVNVAPAFALGVVLWALLACCSAVWLRRHHTGPAEWLWRTLARA